MGKKKVHPKQNNAGQEKPTTLKDMLNHEIIVKLQAQADEMRRIAEKEKEEKRKQTEAARKAEQKRRESDFEYLLNNSEANWRKYK